eukprot:jgi/Picsp_1/4685/NSC_02054-R1_fumarate reductase flavoprotein subunit
MGPVLRIVAVAIVAHVCFRIIRSPDWEIASAVARNYFLQLKDLKFNLVGMGVPQSWDGEAAIVIVGAGSAGLVNFGIGILEKEAFAGGNSMRASSGMNAYTDSSRSTGDSIDQFKRDTLASRGGGGLSDESLVDIVWCVTVGALLSLYGVWGLTLQRIPHNWGGHSQPRTYTVVDGAVGASLVKA